MVLPLTYPPPPPRGTAYSGINHSLWSVLWMSIFPCSLIDMYELLSVLFTITTNACHAKISTALLRDCNVHKYLLIILLYND